MKKGVIFVLIVFSLIGLVDASYLSAQHYSGGEVVCTIGGHQLGNCNTVLESKYATFFGIPNALIGVVYYFFVFVLSAFLLTTANRHVLHLVVLATCGGFLMTLYFVYLQLFVLNAICLYCMVSAVATTVLFFTSALSFRQVRNLFL